MVKKLDFQMITSQSSETVVAGDSHRVHGKIGGPGHIPSTYVEFIIGDQTNIKSPNSSPILYDYLKAMIASAVVTLKDDPGLKQGNAQVSYDPKTKLPKFRVLIARGVDPATVSQVNHIALTLQNRQGTKVNPVAVNIIAVNGKTTLPTNTASVQPSDWQSHSSNDKEGNLIYTVQLTVLAPAMLFNFRQDYAVARNKLTGDDLKTYKLLSPYFSPDQDIPSPVNDIRPPDLFTDSELNFFKEMGNNVTLFIHGYNIGFGQWPVYYRSDVENMNVPYGFSTEENFLVAAIDLRPLPSTLYVDFFRDQEYLSATYPSISKSVFSNLNQDLYVGTEAHCWLLCMEHSLNVAAGFDGKDYSKYTRLVGIAWQGNPNIQDFKAAYGMASYPASKIVALIQQLQGKGIKVNLMAHSLGNLVLMEVLNQTSQAIDHAFLWQAAIGNDAFSAASNPLPVMQVPDFMKLTDIPVPANFPKAQNGASNFTVLYSDDDTVLGNIVANPTQQDWKAEGIHDFYVGLFGNSTLSKIADSVAKFVLIATSDAISPILGFQTMQLALPSTPDDTAGMIMHNTLQDPGAGLLFAAPAEVIFLLDQYGLSHISSQINCISLYHLANLFVEPLSFFIGKGNVGNMASFYSRWQSQYKTFLFPSKDRGNIEKSFGKNLDAQKQFFQDNMTEAYNLLTIGLYHGLNLMQNQGQGQGPDFMAETVKLMKGCEPVTEWIENQVTPYFHTDDYDSTGIIAAYLSTVMLSVILTDTANVPPAMGYSGADQKSNFYIANNEKSLFQSAQKDPSGKDLCVDHSAMLFPTPDFMKYIYKGVLMDGQTNAKVKYFGKWKPA